MSFTLTLNQSNQMYGFLIIVALLCEILAAASYRRRPPSVSKLKYFSKSRKLSDTNFLVEFEIEPHANLGIVTTESHEIIDFHSHHDGFVGIAGDSGHLKIGDVLVAINGVNIEKMSAAEASRVFKAVSRVEPGQNSVKLDLAFRRPATTTTTTSTDTKRLVKKEDDAECHLHLFFSHQDAVKTHETYSKQEHREVPVLMPAKLAEFGMRPEGRLPRAKIVIADHAFGCQPYSSKPSKNEREIVLVRRGQCSYHEKTLHASRAGFMALLVWNDKDETVEMHSSEDNNVDNIAVAMVSYSVGRKIANMITRSHLDVVRGV